MKFFKGAKMTKKEQRIEAIKQLGLSKNMEENIIKIAKISYIANDKPLVMQFIEEFELRGYLTREQADKILKIFDIDFDDEDEIMIF